MALIEVPLNSYRYYFRRLPWPEEVRLKSPPTEDQRKVVLSLALVDISGLKVTQQDALKLLKKVQVAVFWRISLVYRGNLPEDRYYTSESLYEAPDPMTYDKKIHGNGEAIASVADDAITKLEDRFGHEEVGDAENISDQMFQKTQAPGKRPTDSTCSSPSFQAQKENQTHFEIWGRRWVLDTYMDKQTEELTALIASCNEYDPFATIASAVPEIAALQQKDRELAAADLIALPTHKLSFDDASRYVTRWTNSHNRLGMMFVLRPRMNHETWLTLLGKEWSGCDALRHHLSTLRRVLGVAGPLTPMMDPNERTAFAALPDGLTVYRGCSERYPRGVSWSLNPDVARSFVKLTRYWVSDPVLVTATVQKKDVLALKLDREEEEIITFKARRVGKELIA